MGKLVFFSFMLISLPLSAYTQKPPRVPILIELFSSQGCSSCPPAEKLLNTWGMELFEKGQALPLAFHVDYWDSLGWKDPFSSPLFTQRQRQYASALAADSLFTPEMVVEGRSGFNGSDSYRAYQEIAKSTGSSNLLTLAIPANTLGKNLRFKVGVSYSPQDQENPHLKLWAVIFENHLETSVQRGENSGQLLKENFVVRQLSEIQIPATAKTPPFAAEVPWNNRWIKNNTGFAVFLQDSKTMEIKCVKWVYPAVKN